MRLLHPMASKLEQGSIFNCLRVYGYDNCACHGLILNARCDLEHKKQSAINYLPVVSMSDWLTRDFSKLLAKRLIPEFSQSIDIAFKAKNIPESVIGIFPAEEIISREFKGKDQKILSQKLEHLRTAQSILNGKPLDSIDVKKLFAVNPKTTKKTLEELIKQQLPEFYFLNDVDVYDQQSKGYVVLLRCMSTIGCEEMETIITGISEVATPIITGLSSLLTFDHDPICMITGVLRSPDIEHLAQHFSNLYIRIGLEDQNTDLAERYIELLQNSPAA